MTANGSPRVALVTCAAWPDLTPDDRILARALADQGVEPVPERWDAPSRPWEAYPAVVLRSCWDYHHRAAEFLEWVDDLERRGAGLINPAATVRWNVRKTYLADLAARGVAVVPTAWSAEEGDRPLAAILAGRGWDRVVVKPTISATAHQTWRAGPGITAAEEARYRSEASRQELMIQPYLDQIEADGELSLVFLDGEYSHAVRKRPAAGDFRVQADFGGTVEPVQPDASLVAQAARAAALAPAPCLYARVDGCVIGGTLVLMELEVVEPGLFFGHAPGSAGRLARALAARLATDVAAAS